jgi:hypothetical protein
MEMDLRKDVGTPSEECWFCAAMRRLFLATTFLLLIAGLLAIWRFRFEHIPETAAVTLTDLRQAAQVMPPGVVWQGTLEKPTLHLTVDSVHPRVGMRMPLPGFPAMGALLVRFRMDAENLKRGSQEWEDGRALIEWRSPDGVVGQETDPVCSLRDNDVSGDLSLVLRPSSGSSIPVLRVEHLGRGGEFSISNLEMIPVRERAIWRLGRWAMLGAWFLWILVLLSGPERRPVWRKLLAAGICLGMGLQFSVPGPWKTLRPLVTGFEIGETGSSPKLAPSHLREGNVVPAQAVPQSTPSEEVLGMVPLQGGWIMQAKHRLELLKPLIHAMLLFFPMLLITCLVGRKQALPLAIGLAISIEAAQAAFGFGFDWGDVFDLVNDAVGIALALWVYGRLKERGRLAHKK